MSEENCLFCKIIAGKIPGDFVHQDELCVVIRDTNPQAPMHVLVIPTGPPGITRRRFTEGRKFAWPLAARRCARCK